MGLLFILGFVMYKIAVIINSLSFYRLRYFSKWLHRQKVHPQVASWILISSKVFIFKIKTSIMLAALNQKKNSTAIVIRVKS